MKFALTADSQDPSGPSGKAFGPQQELPDLYRIAVQNTCTPVYNSLSAGNPWGRHHEGETGERVPPAPDGG